MENAKACRVIGLGCAGKCQFITRGKVVEESKQLSAASVDNICHQEHPVLPLS